jgi:hypothetical protein
MHKNRVIIVLGILIFFIPQSGFTPSTKVLLTELLAAAVVILALFIERKGFFSLQWRKKNTVTPVARTYVEHNGNATASIKSDVLVANPVENATKK